VLDPAAPGDGSGGAPLTGGSHPALDPDGPAVPTDPALPDPGNDGISLVCENVCEDRTTTECSTARDPLSGVEIRLCREVVKQHCHRECVDDPPNV
jgi:hypothetical protein